MLIMKIMTEIVTILENPCLQTLEAIISSYDCNVFHAVDGDNDAAKDDTECDNHCDCADDNDDDNY